MGKLERHTIIILGASGGLGRKFAKGFYEADANVVLAARKPEKLAEIADSLSLSDHHGTGHTLIVPTDATNPTDLKNLYDQTIERFGSIDGVFITLGDFKILSIDASLEEAKKVLDESYQLLQLTSQLSLFAAQKYLREQEKGSPLVVNVSSQSVTRNMPQNFAYAGAKTAGSRSIEFLQASPKNQEAHIRFIDVRPSTLNTENNYGSLDTEAKRAQVIQPEVIVDWFIEHFDDKNLPPFIDFRSEAPDMEFPE